MVTTELAVLFPGNGGYSLWVTEAFGPFWGFQELTWSWVSGVVDNALYPLFTYKALVIAIFGKPDAIPFFWAWISRMVITVVYSLPGIFALRRIGPGLVLVCVLVLIPFAVLACSGLARNPKWSRLLETESDTEWSDWSVLVGVLYWNFSGMDSMSTCAGEVLNPGRSYSRGLTVCIFLTILTYLIPLCVAAAVNEPAYQEWTDGSFATIARMQGGFWLMAWIAAVSVVGNFGMPVAEMLKDSMQLNGMATAGMVPKIFAYRHPKFGTPWTCIGVQLVIICLLQAFDFNVILCIDNFFSVLGALLEVIAYLHLKRTRPELAWHFNLSVISSFVCMVPTLLIGILVAGIGLSDSVVGLGVNLSFLVFGVVLYYFVRHSFGFTYRGTYSERKTYTDEEDAASDLGYGDPSSKVSDMEALVTPKAAHSGGDAREELGSSSSSVTNY
jgi:amino acid transporter